MGNLFAPSFLLLLFHRTHCVLCDCDSGSGLSLLWIILIYRAQEYIKGPGDKWATQITNKCSPVCDIIRTNVGIYALTQNLLDALLANNMTRYDILEWHDIR